MIARLKEEFMAFMNTRLKGPKERFMGFYMLRQDREKKMIVVLCVGLLLFVDYWLLINPVVSVFTKKMPELGVAAEELKSLRTDKKQEAALTQNWEVLRQRNEKAYGKFIASGEMPALLENLSKLAQSSGVKILSVEPREPVSSRMIQPYSMVPIKIRAIAGTHQTGRFLALLESNPTFFRVANLKIAEDPPDLERHSVELDLEAYRKVEHEVV